MKSKGQKLCNNSFKIKKPNKHLNNNFSKIKEANNII
jgi:hypothetical protein